VQKETACAEGNSRCRRKQPVKKETAGAEGNMPHSGTRVKLEKNGVSLNCCETVQNCSY
jgi:hypothetical protein